MHVDASNFSIGCILAQLEEHKMDFPMSCASKQLNEAKKNYTMTKSGGMGMIYVIKMFRNYRLANKFVFFSNLQALLFLVNKPCNIGLDGFSYC